MSSTTIARGNILEQFIIAPSITPSALTTSSTQSLQTFNVAGLQPSDIVTFLQYQGNQTSNIMISNCDVATAGVLTIQFQNTSGAATAITPAAGVYDFKVHRIEGLPIAVNAA
jgi:hypothetical protein